MKSLQKNWLADVLSIIILLILWQFCYFAANEPIIFPSLSSVYTAAVIVLQTQNFWVSYAHTMLTLLLAWFVNCVFVTISVTICMLSPLARHIFERYCSYFMPLPSFVLIPFLLLFFGFSQATVYMSMILGAFWSISYQMLSAIDTVVAQWSKHAHNLRWNLYDKLTKIYLPALAPQLISICSMGWIYMWRVLITIEVAYGAIGGYFGLGSYLISLKSTLDIDRMYVILFTIAITGVIINMFLERLASRFTW